MSWSNLRLVAVCCICCRSLTHRLECQHGGEGKNLCSPVAWVGKHLHVERLLSKPKIIRKVHWKFTAQIKIESANACLSRQVVIIPWRKSPCAMNTSNLMGLPMAALKKPVWAHISESAVVIEHRASSAAYVGSVLHLGLDGVLHFAFNPALLRFATCKCSVLFWNCSLNL